MVSPDLYFASSGKALLLEASRVFNSLRLMSVFSRVRFLLKKRNSRNVFLTGAELKRIVGPGISKRESGLDAEESIRAVSHGLLRCALAFICQFSLYTESLKGLACQTERHVSSSITTDTPAHANRLPFSRDSGLL